MGMNRLDIVATDEGRDGRTYYTKVGVAFALRSGGFRLELPPGVMVGSGVLLLTPKDKGPAEAEPEEDQDIPF